MQNQTITKMARILAVILLCAGLLWSVRATLAATARIPPTPNAPQAARHTSHFTVQYVAEGDSVGDATCHTWPTNVTTTFEYALDIWADLLYTPTIKIVIQACWANLTDTQQYIVEPIPVERYGAPEPGQDSWYPAALANTLSGYQTTGVQLSVIYNRTSPWYYGTNGTPGAEEYDFVTTALRQIVQGIGFRGFMTVKNNLGRWQYSNDNPAIYDRFIVNGSGEVLFLNYSSGSAGLANQLQSNNLYFNGYSAAIANGGTPPKLYAPTTWESGISYIHLDDSYHGTENGLMAPPAPGVAYHEAGPVLLGIMRDIGWNITYNTPPIITGLPNHTLPMNGQLDSALDLWPYASDTESADDALLSFSVLSGDPHNPGVSIQNGHYLSISLQSGWQGTATITLQVADPQNATATDEFQITTAANSPPTLAPIPDILATTNSHYTEAVNLRQYASDPEDHPSMLTFHIRNTPAVSANVTIAAGYFLEVYPASAYTGTTTVTLQVTDSGGKTAQGTCTVIVTAKNIPPIIQIHDKRVFINDTVQIDLHDLDWDGDNDYARDPEGAPITITIANTPAAFAGVSVVANRYINIEPTGADTGSTPVEVRVTDSRDTTTTKFTVHIWDYAKAYLPLVTRNFSSSGEEGR